MNICKVDTTGMPKDEKENWQFLFNFILNNAPGG
jgi:hypothetical protein